MSRTLFWYVFKDLLRIFFMASGALAGIMSFGGLLRPLTQNGLDGAQVALLLRYFMPAMSTYSLPIAALFATTVVYGRMSADNEVTACRASGISFIAMTTPAMFLGVLVAIGSMFLLCFTVPNATMKVEQVIYSNLAKLIAHQIEQSHQTGLGGFTVFANSAELPASNAQHPHDQAVILRGPLILSYITPPGRPPWYHCAKEFWSSSIATAHIRENPEDSSAQLTVTLDDGVVFPRQFADPKAAKTTHAGVGAAQFGPVLIPSPIGQKTKFMSIYELKDLQKDPSKGKQVQVVLDQFIKEDQSQSLMQRLIASLQSDAGQCELRGADDTYIVAAPGATITQLVDSFIITAGKSPVQFRQESNGQVRLTAQGSTCHVSISADPENEQAFVSLEIKDALVDSGDTQTPAPLSRKFVVPLPPEIAAYKSRTFDNYRTGNFRDAQAMDRLIFAWTDLVNHIISEVQGRAAFVVSCLLLVMVGSSLGMMFRSGNFLTAFAVSVIPAMLSTVLIVTGQHTVEGTSTHPLAQASPVMLGISLIWSGNVLIFIGAVILLWRLQRR